MSSKVTQHAGKAKSPQYLCEEFHQICEKGVSARVMTQFLLDVHMISVVPTLMYDYKCFKEDVCGFAV